jgi:hypothetical protein
MKITDEDIEDLSELGLSTRATNALARVGIDTMKRLLVVPMAASDDVGFATHLGLLHNVGRKTETEILEAVERAGKRLASAVPLTDRSCRCPACDDTRPRRQLATEAAEPVPDNVLLFVRPGPSAPGDIA